MITSREFHRRYAEAFAREEMCPPTMPIEWMSQGQQLAHRITAYFPDANNVEIQVIHCATEAYWEAQCRGFSKNA